MFRVVAVELKEDCNPRTSRSQFRYSPHLTIDCSKSRMNIRSIDFYYTNMMDADPSSSSSRTERCPSCPASGPPEFMSSTSTLPSPPPDDDGPDGYVWIACNLCDTWFHTVCILSGDVRVKDSVPLEIVEEIEGNHPDEGVWTDWSKWVERWCVWLYILLKQR
jgi:hypothetical protein